MNYVKNATFEGDIVALSRFGRQTRLEMKRINKPATKNRCRLDAESKKNATFVMFLGFSRKLKVLIL